MKNLLIYINPAKTFDEESSVSAKIQIDNSLQICWSRDDIVLVTNFAYEYNGVKSKVLGDENFCDFDRRMSKINVLVSLFENGLIEDDLYWYHDFDAYQLDVINYDEIDLGTKDIGITDVGWSSKLNTGSFFFKKSAGDIFKMMKRVINEYKITEEDALVKLIDEGDLSWDRIKKLNITYNLGMYHVERIYKKAEKPLKVVHFHIFKRGGYLVQVFKPLMPARVIAIFDKHGIR